MHDQRTLRPPFGTPGYLRGPGDGAPRDSEQRSIVADTQQHIQTIECGFSRIERDANLTTVGTAHMPALYGLAKIRLPEDVGFRGVSYVGADIHLLPCDFNGNGLAEDANEAGVDTTAGLAWGDFSGRTAAIVVGLNLGSVEGEWNQAPVRIPGIQNAEDHYTRRIVRSPLLAVAYFPPGAFGNSTDPSLSTPIPYAFNTRNGQKRLPQGATLDIAFVCRRGQIAADSANVRYVCGHAFIQVHLAEATPSADFGI